MNDGGGRSRRGHYSSERQRRDPPAQHPLIPRTPTANNVDAALSSGSSGDSNSTFFRGAAANGKGDGADGQWGGGGAGSGTRPLSPLSPLRSTEKAKSKSNKRAEWMQRQLKLRAGTLEKLEALLNTNPADDDDENGDLDSIAHIDKDLIPKISRLRGDREELIRMCSDAVQELNRKEEQNRALEEANQAQGKLIGELQQQMQELREQMERLVASQQQPKQPVREEARRRTTSTRGGEQIGERRGGGARRGPDSRSSSSGRRHRARGRGIDGSEGTEFSSEGEGEDDDDVYTNGRHQRGGGGGGGGHRRNQRRGGGRRHTYSDEEDSDGSHSDYETGSSGDDADSYDDDDNDSSGRRRDRRKHARTSKGRSAGRKATSKPGHRHAIGSDADEAGDGALQHTVSHLSSRCSDLELGKKLLCIKLASTTERLNNMHLQNKALLNAMYACSAHNAEVKTILERIEP